MIKWLAKNPCAETHVFPGDTVVVRHTSAGQLLNTLSVEVTEHMTYDTIGIAAVEGELGLSAGLVCAFGRA